MILQILIGALALYVLIWLRDYARSQALSLPWWQWLVTGLGIIYGVFVIEVILGFLREGEPRAALVMGVLTGLLAVIWGVLLGRFVFSETQEL